MKDKIHPEYKESTIVCACGATIHTRSTKQNIHIEICSRCHPFFTGKQKLVDSAGRVDKFMKRYEKKQKPKQKQAAQPKKPDDEQTPQPSGGNDSEATPKENDREEETA